MSIVIAPAVIADLHIFYQTIKKLLEWFTVINVRRLQKLRALSNPLCKDPWAMVRMWMVVSR